MLYGGVVNMICVARAASPIPVEMHERLRQARIDAGWTEAAEAARRFGWNLSTYRAHENGQNPIPRTRAPEYARAFRVSPEWLLLGTGDGRRRPVPLVGYIGAGAEVYALDDGGSLDDIDAPPGIGPEAVAVQVRGSSMYPRYMDGDVLIYDAHTTLAKADGQECVVALTDGRRFVKIVRAEGRGVATLESWNAPPIRSVAVEWVGLIKWVKRGAGQSR